MIEEDPIEKKSLGRPKLRWEDYVKKDVRKIEPEVSWKETKVDRDKWQDFYLAIWF